jgi:hypothetical protein
MSVDPLMDEELEYGLLMILYRDAVLVQFAERMGQEFGKTLDYEVWLSYDNVMGGETAANPFRKKLMHRKFHYDKRPVHV